MKHICLLIVLIYTLNSCKSDSSESINNTSTLEEEVIKLSPNRPNLNISILIDLSDRINPKKYPNPAMNYFERDLGYIHSIVQSFEWHVRNKRSLKINDHIQLYIDPEPADNDLNEKINSLNITFTKNNAKRELIKSTSTLYDSISNGIYKSAINDGNYVGSDIWGFFKTNVKDFCIQKDYRNILIILTDGYLYHRDSKLKEKNLSSYLTPQDIRRFKLNKSDWKDRIQNQGFGFIAARNDLEELEVLVLGINPDAKNPYEQDVIIQYWSDWLTKMNVKDFELKTANLPANMDKIIKEYILNKSI
jgi:hypothetical protein